MSLPVKYFLSVLTRALRRARHFALVDALPYQPRLARNQFQVGYLEPSRPGDFYPEPLTEPDLNLSAYPARATRWKTAVFHRNRVPPVAR